MATQVAETTDGPGARRIVGAVELNGHTYVAGEEDALAAVLPASDIQRLVAANVLAGDWNPVPNKITRNDGQPISAPPADEKIVPPAPQRPTVTKKAATTAAPKKSTPKRGS